MLVTSLRHAETAPDEIEILAVATEGTWRVTTPFLEFAVPPNGAGDMLAALFLGHYLKARDCAKALEAAVAAVFAVIAATPRGRHARAATGRRPGRDRRAEAPLQS